ncbi:MAG: GIY-YIG nuclease family protein [Planctomycetota bacterium]
MSASDWHVYLVRCRNGALYTGIATDVARRFEEHGEGRGAKALRGRGPLELVYQRPVGERGLALRVESLIKRLPKARKEELVACDGLFDELLAGIDDG